MKEFVYDFLKYAKTFSENMSEIDFVERGIKRKLGIIETYVFELNNSAELFNSKTYVSIIPSFLLIPLSTKSISLIFSENVLAYLRKS